MAVHFYIHQRGGNNRTPATVLIAVLRGNNQIKYATPIRVAPKNWSKRRERLRPSAPAATSINAALDQLKAEVEALTLSHPSDRGLR